MEIIDERLGKKEVLEYLHCSLSALDDYMESGQLPYSKLAEGKSGKVLFKKSDLDKFLESKMVCPVKDITEKLAEIAERLKRKPRDWQHERNQAENFSSLFTRARELFEKINFENNAEIFWKPSLWEIITTIRRNFSVLFDCTVDFDDEVFCASFLTKLWAKQITFWQKIIQPRIQAQDGLNEKLLAVNLPEGQGIWLATREKDRERTFRICGGHYRITNEFQAIPAPASPEDEKQLFNARDLYLKIATAGEPHTIEQRQVLEAEAQAKLQAAMDSLIDETEAI